jgi:hypothetical protein
MTKPKRRGPTMRKALTFILITLTALSALTHPLPAIAGGWNAVTLLNAVTATGASTAYELAKSKRMTFFITGTGGTVGATVQVQTSADNTNWSTIETVTLSAATTTSVALVGVMYRYVRVNVSAYTAGSITAVLGWD